MKERPILFSGPMVRAILDGRKTQTRRVMRVGWHPSHGLDGCPYGKPSDRMWVRETWAGVRVGRYAPIFYRASCAGDECDFVDPRDDSISRVKIAKWRPSIYMPREASRITLEVIEVRAQRLHEISDSDARAEGVVPGRIAADEDGPERIGYVLGDDDGGCVLYPTEGDAFAVGWDTLNGERAPWSSNPWVWAITFRRAA